MNFAHTLQPKNKVHQIYFDSSEFIYYLRESVGSDRPKVMVPIRGLVKRPYGPSDSRLRKGSWLLGSAAGRRAGGPGQTFMLTPQIALPVRTNSCRALSVERVQVDTSN